MDATTLHIEESYMIDNQVFNPPVDLTKAIIKKLLGSIEGLNLDSLTDIYFPKEYIEFVKSFNKCHGLEGEVTNTISHKGVAIACEYFNEEQEVKSVIIFEPVILVHLLSIANEVGDYDIKMKRLVLSTFFHEIYHVHDFANYQKNMSDMNLNMDFFEVFYNVWTEYYVHRNISKLYPTHTLNELQEDLQSNIDIFTQTLNDRDYIKLPSKLSMISRNIGDLHAFESGLDEIDINLKKVHTLKNIESILKKMYDKYPKWGKEDLIQSNKIVEEFYNKI